MVFVPGHLKHPLIFVFECLLLPFLGFLTLLPAHLPFLD